MLAASPQLADNTSPRLAINALQVVFVCSRYYHIIRHSAVFYKHQSRLHAYEFTYCLDACKWRSQDGLESSHTMGNKMLENLQSLVAENGDSAFRRIIHRPYQKQQSMRQANSQHTKWQHVLSHFYTKSFKCFKLCNLHDKVFSRGKQMTLP